MQLLYLRQRGIISVLWACLATENKAGEARIYTPVSTSLAVFSSIFLSILSHSGSGRSMCVARATEQEAEGEALSSVSPAGTQDTTLYTF